MIRTVFGSNKSGTALIPILGTDLMRLEFSTRIGDSVVSWGDGSDSHYVNPKNYDYTSNTFTDFSHNYTSRFNGNIAIKFLKGLKDVYSIKLNRNYYDKASSTILAERYNITDIQSFFAQFPNLYSICINEYAYGEITRQSIIKGDLAQFPNSVEKVLVIVSEVVNSATDFILNFSSYTNSSNLKFFKVDADFGGFKLIGDLSKLPPLCNFLYLGKASSGSAITYTAGKVWASSFDTLYLPIPLTPTETDNLLIDLYNSVTTAIGDKIIRFGGVFRTHASDSAVTYLQGLGFTITNIVVQENYIDSTTGLIFRMDFQNNFDTYGNSIVPITEGNTNGLPSFISDGSGGYAVNFVSNKSIKTSVNLPINTSDKVSIEFDIKTSATATQSIMELSTNFNANNSFAVFVNNTFANKIEIIDHNSGLNVGNSPVTINDGNYHSIKMVIDRSLGTAQNKIYVDGVLSYVQNMSYTTDNNGNFGSFTLFIGQRNGSSFGFVGQMKNLKIYNYPIL